VTETLLSALSLACCIELFEPDDRVDAALSALLVVSVLLALGSVGYAVVVQLQTVETTNNSTTVLERTELNCFDATVAHNETHRERHTLRPTRPGENLRVQYLLYEGTPPSEPTGENAYRELHLWIDVE